MKILLQSCCILLMASWACIHGSNSPRTRVDTLFKNHSWRLLPSFIQRTHSDISGNIVPHDAYERLVQDNDDSEEETKERDNWASCNFNRKKKKLSGYSFTDESNDSSSSTSDKEDASKQKICFTMARKKILERLKILNCMPHVGAQLERLNCTSHTNKALQLAGYGYPPSQNSSQAPSRTNSPTLLKDPETDCLLAPPPKQSRRLSGPRGTPRRLYTGRRKSNSL